MTTSVDDSIKNEIRCACAMMIDADAEDIHGFILTSASQAKLAIIGCSTLVDDEVQLVRSEVSDICAHLRLRDQTVEHLENSAYNTNQEEGQDGSR